MFSSSNLMVWSLSFRSFIYFESIFAQGIGLKVHGGVGGGEVGSVFCRRISTWPRTIYGRGCPFSNVVLVPSLTISWVYMHGFISAVSTLFHWSVCLFLQASTMLFWLLQLCGMSLYIMFKISLDIWGILYLYMNFRIFFLSSVENVLGILMEIELNL